MTFASDIMSEEIYRFLNGEVSFTFEGTPLFQAMERLNFTDVLNLDDRNLVRWQGGWERNPAKLKINQASGNKFFPFNIINQEEIRCYIWDTAPTFSSFFLCADQEEAANAYVATNDGFQAAELDRNEVALYRIEGGNIVTYKVQWPAGYSGGGSGGNGAMRADSVGEVDYLWTGKRSVGYALGLKVVNYRSSPLEFNEDGEFFNRSNQPFDKVYYSFPTPVENMFSDVQYVNKFKIQQEASRANPPQATPQDGKKNEPRITLPAPALKFFTENNFKTNFILKQGKTLLHRSSGKREKAGSVMAKGLLQYEVFKDGYKDVMNTEDASINSVSASDFTDYLLNPNRVENNPVIPQWKAHKQKAWLESNENLNAGNLWNDNDGYWKQRNTDQEWCHLFGHGDGGLEFFGNFVAGSKHANTIQLAIETGQRRGQPKDLEVEVSAFLFEDEELLVLKRDYGQSEIPSLYLSVLANDDELPDAPPLDDNSEPVDVPAKRQRRKPKVPLPENFILRVLDSSLEMEDKINFVRDYCFTYPLAKFIRYKIFHKKEGKKVLIFDHIFDAQSESFDYNEFKILETTVVRVISQAIQGNLEGYKDYLFSKIKRKKAALERDWRQMNTGDDGEIDEKDFVLSDQDIKGLIEEDFPTQPQAPSENTSGGGVSSSASLMQAAKHKRKR